MDKKEFERIRVDLIEALNAVRYIGICNGLDDFGNQIGIVLGKFNKAEIYNFMSGLKHGISLSDGTH
jgi:hypothetical protein